MTLSKLEIMKQKSLRELLIRLVDNSPGVTTQKLWDKAKEWKGEIADERKALEYTLEFERVCAGLLNHGYRVTNKQWYPANHVAPPKVSGPKEAHPKQTRWAF